MEFLDEIVNLGKLEGRYKSKNLEAERKRRAKLKQNILALRSLVPNITKMSKESVLDDAMDYIKELRVRISQLQMELEELNERENGSRRETHFSRELDVGCNANVDVSPIGINGFYAKITSAKERADLAAFVETMARKGLEVSSVNFTAMGGASEVLFCIQGALGVEIKAEDVKELLLSVVLKAPSKAWQ